MIKNTVRFLCAIAIVCLLSFQAFGDEVLNNSSIIDLQKIGLSESTIIQKINSSKCNFDTSISGLKQLKAANVSDNVIQAMMSGGSSAGSSSSSTGPAAAQNSLPKGNVNDPNTAHDLGIWMFQGGKMNQLDPSAFNDMKVGSGWGMAWGGSSHMRLVLNGEHAKLQLSDRKPVFYFYLGDDSINGSSTADDFTLMKSEAKKDHDLTIRTIIVGKMSGFGGSHMGFDPKWTIAVESTKIAKGVYKVVPKDDLPDGEYCFCQNAYATGPGGKGYDFGVAGPASK